MPLLRPPSRGVARCQRWAAKNFALALCGVVLLAGAGASGDIQQPPKPTGKGDREVRRQSPPASALPGRARVALDGSVDIHLEASGGEGKSIEFILREPPAHGTLDGPPRQLTRTSAVVTYVHHAEDGAATDGFTFAVQSLGGKVSASAPVTISVSDAAPELAASPAELDFGAVKTGESSHAELTLENRGGGVAVGRVSPPSPWQVEGAADYRLAHGEKQTFRIVFQPEYGNAFTASWRPGGEDGRGEVRLIGSGLGPAFAAARAPTPPPLAVPDTSGLPMPSDRAGATPALVAPPPAPPVAASDTPPAAGPPRTAPPPVPVAPLDTEPMPNLAGVTQARVAGAESGAVDLAWIPPTPTPRSYRVEMRFLLLPLPEDEQRESSEIVPPRIEWREYTRTDLRAHADEMTAHLRGLSPSTIYALRVVAVDAAGRAADPSPVVFAQTQAGSTFWHPTTLKVLCLLLAVALVIYVRRRWQERRLMEEETRELERSLHANGASW